VTTCKVEHFSENSGAGTPEEIADAIVFVASAKAAFITGQIIRVNGGKTAP
jgi:NAD(P)-dependent dehydrogenase (short-subunit alcohol dehydrogenase family)